MCDWYHLELEAEIRKLEAEITAWEAKAAEFVDQGELIEQLKAECAGLELMLSEGAEFDQCDDCEYKKEIERQKAELNEYKELEDEVACFGRLKAVIAAWEAKRSGIRGSRGVG